MARELRVSPSTIVLVLAALAAGMDEPVLTTARAAMQDDVPFTVYITELVQLDEGVDPVGQLGDYYARVTINGVAQDSKSACGDAPNPLSGILVPFTLFSNFTHVSDCDPSPWSFTQQVPADAPVTVRILVLDSDFATGDDDADATPGPGDAIELVVDPATGRWSGTFEWPQGCSRQPPFELGNNNVRVCVQASFDADGDGLLDVWERSGLDTDHDGVIDLNLPALGADPRHKDLFVELDWMPGVEPSRDNILEWKAAFAAAPADSGGTPNPDGQPGINLWVDTGALTEFGDLVGDDLGGGNEVPLRNVSALTRRFYQVKAGNFAVERALVFRYGLSSPAPPNSSGTSTGDNTKRTLNDTTIDWIPNEWSGRQVEIVGGTGEGQTRTIVSNTATRLTVAKDWDPIPDETWDYAISGIGGMGEIGGNDFVEYNHSSKTMMHELGHTLNLGHGGGKGLREGQDRDHNCKPNYVSIMNNDHERIFQVGNGDGIIDYSPPRQVLGGRSSGLPPDLDENALVEGLVLDAGDPDNMFVFVEQGVCDGGEDNGEACVVDDDCESEKCVGTKIMHPLSVPVDWNGSSDEPRVNIDTVDGSGEPTALCKNNALEVLQGHDDWRNISLPFIGFSDSADDALNPADGPEPTLEEELRLLRKLNTADLGIVQNAPAAVEVGGSFNLRLTVGNKGPNPALVVEVADTLPPGVTVLGAGGCAPGPPGRLTCGLSTMLRGATRQVDLTLGTDGGVCVNGLPQPLTNIVTAANVSRFAGPDRNPSDNVSSATVTPIDTTAPIIESLTTDAARLWPPNHRMVPVTVSAAVADLCDSAPACRIISVTSNEPVNGRGDGNTSPDWEIASDRVVNLRAEREGGGPGRVYTVTTECQDASGNRATAAVNVTVPRSAGR